MTPGTYTYMWGSGTDADSLTLNVGVPEPETAALFGTGLLGLLLIRRHRRA